MRISTSQFYSKNTQNILNRQSDVNSSIQSLSSGKRVLTAGDDSIAANSILNIRQEQAMTNQYRTNINYAESRINVEESVLQAAENVMFKIKDLILQGNSVVNDDGARGAIADELEARFDELLSLANSRDESGSHVFGGFQTVNPPFERQSDNSVNYVGDKGQRLTNVGPGVQVATSDSGDELFLNIPNAVGDFKPTYSLVSTGASIVDEPIDRAIVSSATISDRTTYIKDDYTIDFTKNATSGDIEVTVYDSSNTAVYPTAPFVAGEPISFNGVEVVITRQPQDGDKIALTPQDSVDIFTTIEQAIDWMRSPNGTGVDEAKRQIDIGHIIGNIDSTQIKFGNVRAEIGTRLQLTESQLDRHLDYDLTLEKSRSSLEDLDMVAAISEFEKQKLALQASQTAFSKVQSMNLLNYL